METGHVVRFASQTYPFMVETTPCLDLACSCSVMTLTLAELAPPGSPPRDRLSFTLRVCLKTWVEHDPPPRSLEVESLAREFLARFPIERIRELAEQFQRAREIEERLKSLSLSGSRDELVRYSSVVDKRGGVREGVSSHSFFFVFEGREFLVEDHYCANPECDCKQVHLEFWERIHEVYPMRRITLQQKLMATFTLEGKLTETRFVQESASTTKHLLRAWIRRGGVHFKEFRRRYELIKSVGARSFAPKSETRANVVADKEPQSDKRVAPLDSKQRDSKQRVRRNDPCPCGSGLKFKRCCARRSATAD